MSTLIVTDNEFATVRYYTESGILHHEWKKYCHGKVFRDIMLASTRCLKENKGTKWLSVMFSEYRAAGINAQAFDTVPEAMAWLETQ